MKKICILRNTMVLLVLLEKQVLLCGRKNMFITIFMIVLAVFGGSIFGKALSTFQTEYDEYIRVETD